MKKESDFYTKFILTVIAVFLGILVFQNFNVVEKANANPLPLPHATDGETIKVDVVRIGGKPIWGKVPVEVIK